MELNDSADAIDGHPNEVLPLGVWAEVKGQDQTSYMDARNSTQFSSIISTSVFSPRQLTNIWI